MAMKLRAPVTLYANSTSDRIVTPAGTRGDPPRSAAATIDMIMLTSASGGELIETIVRIAIPAAIAIGAAASGVMTASSETARPNQVQRMPDIAK